MTHHPANLCLSLSELQAAESGTLQAERLRHLSACPLCSAAYEGLSLADESCREEILDANPRQTPQVYLNEAKVVPLASRRNDKPEVAHAHPARPLWLWPGLAMAASIIIGVVLLNNLHRNGQSQQAASMDQDFNAIVEPFARRERGEFDAERIDAYQQAAVAYEQGDYSTAASAYRNELALHSDPLHDTRGYYELGITYWRLGQLDSAADYLTRARMGESEFFEDASWALARVYLVAQDSGAAHIVLRDLAGLRQGPYVTKARELLEQF